MSLYFVHSRWAELPHQQRTTSYSLMHFDDALNWSQRNNVHSRSDFPRLDQRNS